MSTWTKKVGSWTVKKINGQLTHCFHDDTSQNTPKTYYILRVGGGWLIFTEGNYSQQFSDAKTFVPDPSHSNMPIPVLESEE